MDTSGAEMKSQDDKGGANGLAKQLFSAGLGGEGEGAAAYEAVRVGLGLVEKIGEGGEAEVFLAEESRPFRRTVVLKRFRESGSESREAHGFASQREALGRLNHPHIARVFESGVDTFGRLYYCMEVIDGPTLDAYCRRHRPDQRVRLRLFLCVCEAIAHAHQHGVWHGDIKPSNVLVAVDEAGQPVPKVIDFGSVGWERRRFGTPGYAGPEQYSRLRAPDARSDVYALGVLLKELSEGTPGAIPLDLGWIVKRATEAIPENRYPDVGALAADVQRFLESRPVTAVPSSALNLYRLWLLGRRHWRALGVALAMGVLLAAGLDALWRTHRAEKAAIVAKNRASSEAVRADIARHLASAGRLQLAGRYDEAERVLQEALMAAGGLKTSETTWEREVQRALARLYLIQRRHRQAEAVLIDLVASPPESVDDWEPRLDLIRLYLESRRFEQADASAKSVLAGIREWVEPRHPIYLKAIHLEGRVHVELYRYVEAYRALKEAVDGFRRHFGPDAIETRQAMGDLAEVVEVLRNQERLPKD